MRGTWVLALAMGATLAGAAPSTADAQSRSIRERWEQTARRNDRDDNDDRDRDRARERERERERARAVERERERIRARERELERERIRARERERERIRELERERERLRARERELERERLRNRRDRDRDDDDDDDDYRRSRNGNGPAFCRSGAGHPVHGRDWCRRKGYELGRERDRGRDRWERSDRWGNIVFRDSHRRRRDERLSHSALSRLLGNTMLNRFESYGRQHGNGPVTGYWLPEGSAHVLQLNVGSVPYARLIDFNRDGRVDNLLLRR